MTGETEKGRSIRVMRKDFPLNSNFAIAHEATRPKTRLAGTEIAATKSVRRMEASASGSTSAARKGSTPRRKASKKTAARGRKIIAPRKTIPSAMRATFTGKDSLIGVRKKGRG